MAETSEDHVDPRCRPSVQKLLNKRLGNFLQPSDFQDDNAKEAAGLTPIMEDDGCPDGVEDSEFARLDGPESAHNQGCTLFRFCICPSVQGCAQYSTVVSQSGLRSGPPLHASTP